MNDRIIVITGASEGLGKVTAIKLSAEGATVALVAQNEDKLKQTANEIGEKAHPYVCDVSSAEQVRGTVSKILSDLGRVDILINCAGIWTDEELEKTNPDRRKKV